MLIEPLAELARAVASSLDWPGEPVAISNLEAPVVAVVVVDENEHHARQGSSVGAVPDLRALAALWELPHRLPVPMGDLPAPLRSRLRALPTSVVDLDVDSVERRVRMPVRISGVVAAADTWPRSAAALGAFVTVAPRVAVLGVSHSVPVAIHAEAVVWEIGLFRAGASPEVLLAPGPAAIEHGPFQWWLAERAYAAWLRIVTARPRPPVAASGETAAWPGSRSCRPA